MSREALVLIPLLFGCAGDADSTATSPWTSPTGGTTSPETASPPTPPPGCDDLPDQAVLGPLVDIQTEEDFDFGPDGRVVYQVGPAVVGTDMAGETVVYAGQVTHDPSGIQVGPDGNLVVAGQDTGALYTVDVSTGGVELLFAGLTHPNGLEVTAGGRVYVTEFVSEGAVRWYDLPTDDTGWVVDDQRQPNGIAWDPLYERVVFVGERGQGKPGIFEVRDGFEGKDAVYADWDAHLDGVEVDACGNIYAIDYQSGELLRISPDGATIDVLITLTDDNPTEWFNSLRWGSEAGGWGADTLYVTDRRWLYPLDVGAPGRAHPWAN